MTESPLAPGIQLLEHRALGHVASANRLIVAINVLLESAGDSPLANLNLAPAANPPQTQTGISVTLTSDELAALNELLTATRASPDSSPALDFLLGPIVTDWRDLLEPLQQKIAAADAEPLTPPTPATDTP